MLSTRGGLTRLPLSSEETPRWCYRRGSAALCCATRQRHSTLAVSEVATQQRNARDAAAAVLRCELKALPCAEGLGAIAETRRFCKAFF
jgi:hypothetical protein